MFVTLVLGMVFSLHVQIYAINLSNILFMVYLVIHKPFDETKENLGLIINEGAFTVAAMLLPFIMEVNYQQDAGDMMLYILQGSTMLGGAVSSLFLVAKISSLIYNKFRKRQPRERNQDSIDREYDFARGTDEFHGSEEKKKRYIEEESKDEP